MFNVFNTVTVGILVGPVGDISREGQSGLLTMVLPPGSRDVCLFFIKLSITTYAAIMFFLFKIVTIRIGNM